MIAKNKAIQIVKARQDYLIIYGGIVVKKEVIYRCPKECRWNKSCFVCKTDGQVTRDVVVLHRCKVTKEDIPVHLMERD